MGLSPCRVFRADVEGIVTPGDIRRAYGCPHQTARQMWLHLQGKWPCPAYDGIFRIGPLRCHWFEQGPAIGNGSKWHVDNRPVSYRGLRNAI